VSAHSDRDAAVTVRRNQPRPVRPRRERERERERGTHPARDAGELDVVAQPDELLLVLVGSYGLVDVIEGSLGELERAREARVVGVVGRRVAQDLRGGGSTASAQGPAGVRVKAERKERAQRTWLMRRGYRVTRCIGSRRKWSSSRFLTRRRCTSRE